MTKFVAVLLIIFLACSFVFAFNHREELFRQALEWILNQETQELFSGSIRLEKVRIERDLKIQVDGFRAKLQTKDKPVPFQIRSIESENSAIHFLKEDGLSLRFLGFIFEDSKYPGIHGKIKLKGIRGWFFNLEARVDGVGLEEMIWLNPENLRGASGKLKGNILLRASKGKEPALQINLHVDEPGGVFQPRFLNFLLPYLPETARKIEVKQLAASGGLIHYQDATLTINMARSDVIKLFLIISIPDYNLRFNTNVDIQIDAKNAFGQMGEILGLIGAGKT